MMALWASTWHEGAINPQPLIPLSHTSLRAVKPHMGANINTFQQWTPSDKMHHP